MAIVKAAARLLLREQRERGFLGPALCFGVPDVYLTAAELASARGEVPTALDNAPITAAEFLGAMGIHETFSIDIPGSSHKPDLVHDLNTLLPENLHNRFGLVLDPATTEHVFDVRAALTNVLLALRIGGVVAHFVPIYSYNGGYFSINPTVLHDFYQANRCEVLSSYIIMWDRYRPFADRTRCYFYTPRLQGRHALADRDQCRFTPHLLFLARKRGEIEPVVSPIQQHDHQDETGGRSRVPTPLRRVLRTILPAELVTYLAARRTREQQLRIARQDSFWI